MNEKHLEKSYCRMKREDGWLAVKIENVNHSGIPDRLFVPPLDFMEEWEMENNVKLPPGAVLAYFTEFKSPKGTGRLSELQKSFIKRLRASVINHI